MALQNPEQTSAAPEEPRRGPRITRVYTKIGDKGTTGLVGGQTVAKDNPRIEAYGSVDELSATLGLARQALERDAPRFPDPADAELLGAHLRYLQNQLFTLGGDLATRIADRHPAMPVITQADIDYLESVCDAFNASLPPLMDFVLPGGTDIGAALHLARTVCRRAERRITTLAAAEDIGPFAAIHLNRLADALFVFSRWANARIGVDEPTWQRNPPRPALPAAPPAAAPPSAAED